MMLRLWFAGVLLALMLSIPVARSESQAYNLLPATTTAAGWTLQHYGTANAYMGNGGQTNGLKVSVASSDGTDWHAMLVSPSITIVDGNWYTLSFVAKASAATSITTDLRVLDADQHSVGMENSSDLTTVWRKYHFTFKASASNGRPVQLVMFLGKQMGDVYISSVDLVQGALTTLSDFSNPSNWNLELHDPDQGSISQDGDALKVSVSMVDGTDWHIQLYQQNIVLVEGQTYTLSFDAKSSQPETLALSVNNQDSYAAAGLQAKISVAPAWQHISYIFKAQGLNGQFARLPDLSVGVVQGNIWLKNGSIVPSN